MDKALQMLSLARRAGKLAFGFDAVTDSVYSGRSVLILLSDSAAERTRRNILRIAEEEEIPVESVPYTPDDWSNVLGKAPAVISVNDGNLADGIIKHLRENFPKN